MALLSEIVVARKSNNIRSKIEATIATEITTTVETIKNNENSNDYRKK